MVFPKDVAAKGIGDGWMYMVDLTVERYVRCFLLSTPSIDIWVGRVFLVDLHRKWEGFVPPVDASMVWHAYMPNST